MTCRACGGEMIKCLSLLQIICKKCGFKEDLEREKSKCLIKEKQ